MGAIVLRVLNPAMQGSAAAILRYFTSSLLLTCLLLVSIASNAASIAEQRTHVGLKIFAATLAASKFHNRDPGVLQVGVFYNSNELFAQDVMQTLRTMNQIKKRPIRVIAITQSMLETRPPPLDAIFIVSRTPSQLALLHNHCSENNCLTFSSIDGDVAAGIMSGIRIRDRVLPLINVKSLSEGRIKLKEFFMKVAAKHEP